MPLPEETAREQPRTALVSDTKCPNQPQVVLLKEAFEIYDAHAVEKKEKEKKDGLVSEQNLGYILRSVGQNPTDAQVKEFFMKYGQGDKV